MIIKNQCKLWWYFPVTEIFQKVKRVLKIGHTFYVHFQESQKSLEKGCLKLDL
jgi:hypothetical protein